MRNSRVKHRVHTGVTGDETQVEEKTKTGEANRTERNENIRQNKTQEKKKKN